MKKSDYSFELPEELIAQYPLEQRDASRLLVMDRTTGALLDRAFTDILDQLKPGDLLVFNNTRVIPARIIGQKVSGGRIEVFVERVLSSGSVKAMLKSSKAPRLGAMICCDGEPVFRITARQGMFYLLESVSAGVDAILDQYGAVPLPPYIDRAAEQSDSDRYQTVYASTSGAVAAPTAGLHFTRNLLLQLARRQIQTTEVTLHVGAGTFQPVKSDDIRQHRMHREWLEVGPQACEAIAATRASGGRVIAVGTTAVRSLETAAQRHAGELQPYSGDTDIFIYPGYRFQVIDGLLTNFHLPESTLIMLVSALAGRDNVLSAYAHAVAERYRFFSYGDAMLIL